MRELYQNDSSSGSRCPGESKCYRFADEAGNLEEKRLAACSGCELLSTKPQRDSDLPDSESSIAKRASKRVERLRAEQRAGFAVIANSVNALEYEGLIIWHDLESQYERLKQSEQTELLNAFLNAMAKL